ncbi:MAG: phosphatase PAP2 family protein [Nitrospira sp.]|nr:phosphatase PAP2 family protein [Nitrospira sp.]
MASGTAEKSKALRSWVRLAGLGLCCCLVLGPGAWQGLVYAAGSQPTQDVVKEESITEGVKTVVEDAKALIVSPLSMDRYDALKLGGAMAVVGGMFAADHSIKDLVQRNSTTKGRDIADKVNTWGSPGTLLGLNAGVIAIGVAGESYGASSKLKDTGLVSFEAEGFAIVATSALKLVTGRARPEANQGTTHFRPFTGLDGSFASTHASASFAVATVFAERYQGAGWLAYPIALAISGARVYTNKHFSSDVVAGALIGYGLGHFLNARHSDDPTDWKIRPMAMERGTGGGIMIGKQF